MTDRLSHFAISRRFVVSSADREVYQGKKMHVVPANLLLGVIAFGLLIVAIIIAVELWR